MKTASIDHKHWRLGLWVSSLAIAVIFAFGAMVRVGFNDPSVPFSRAWASIRWEGGMSLPRGGEFQLIFAAAVVALVFHSDRRSSRVRLGVMAAAFLAPVFSIGVVMLCMPFLAPWMIGGALLGNVDGEFYCEGMLMIAAIGMWMDVCLVFAAREIWLWRKAGKAAIAGS